MLDDRTVLVVDDDPDFTRLLEGVLSEVVGTVLIANDPAEGLEQARQRIPDLILCDVDMPGIGGFELRRRLSTDPRLRGTPFMFISSHQGREMQLAGLRLGATDYLKKPIDPNGLQARVLYLLEQSTAQVRPSASPDRFSGRMETVPLADVVQILEAGAASGLLTLSGGPLTGQLVFNEGVIVDAECRGLSGEDAALRLFGASRGSFSFWEDDATPAPETHHWRVQSLLMDAAWITDESARLGDSLPGLDESIVIIEPEQARECFPSSPAWESLIAQVVEPLPVRRISEVVEECLLKCQVRLGQGMVRGALATVEED